MIYHYYFHVLYVIDFFLDVIINEDNVQREAEKLVTIAF